MPRLGHADRLVSRRPVAAADSSFPRLVSLAAHDLRTPLATIHGFAQTLVRMDDLDETKRRYMEMIDAASRQLAELLDELGLAARISGGRYEPNLQPVDTLELARGAAAEDRKSTRLNSSHDQISYAVFCLKKKKRNQTQSASCSRA